MTRGSQLLVVDADRARHSSTGHKAVGDSELANARRTHDRVRSSLCHDRVGGALDGRKQGVARFVLAHEDESFRVGWLEATPGPRHPRRGGGRGPGPTMARTAGEVRPESVNSAEHFWGTA